MDKIGELTTFSGTFTYMAPEIKDGLQYDGRKIDIFSTAVIIFVIVLGTFPFREAKKDEHFFSMIHNG